MRNYDKKRCPLCLVEGTSFCYRNMSLNPYLDCAASVKKKRKEPQKEEEHVRVIFIPLHINKTY
jgi:hypothetical protein